MPNINDSKPVHENGVFFNYVNFLTKKKINLL